METTIPGKTRNACSKQQVDTPKEWGTQTYKEWGSMTGKISLNMNLLIEDRVQPKMSTFLRALSF